MIVISSSSFLGCMRQIMPNYSQAVCWVPIFVRSLTIHLYSHKDTHLLILRPLCTTCLLSIWREKLKMNIIRDFSLKPAIYTHCKIQCLVGWLNFCNKFLHLETLTWPGNWSCHRNWVSVMPLSLLKIFHCFSCTGLDWTCWMLGDWGRKSLNCTD